MLNKKFDLKERTFDFGVRVVKLVMKFPKNTTGFKLGEQLIRSGTSIGANVEEADDAHSKKDFIYKIGIARREAKETGYWLRLIGQIELLDPLEDKNEITTLFGESKELRAILSAILTKTLKQIGTD